MSAPSTKQIYNFKGNFVAATKSILEATGMTDVYLERTLSALKSNARKEITFELGEAINESALPNGEHVYDFFAARLRIRIVTARRADQSSPVAEIRDLHDQFTCEVLAAFEEREAPFTTSNLPYYAVKTIRPLGTRSDLDLTFLEDFTDIDFEIQFGIRSDAWPA